jgi:hypothetical protein
MRTGREARTTAGQETGGTTAGAEGNGLACGTGHDLPSKSA